MEIVQIKKKNKEAEIKLLDIILNIYLFIANIIFLTYIKQNSIIMYSRTLLQFTSVKLYK